MRLNRTVLASVVTLGVVAAAQLPRPSPEYAIQMTPSGQTLLSLYKGKVVALTFLDTT